MRIGLQIPSFTWPGGTAEIGPRLASIARTAEDAGFSSIWVMDHFFQLEPMLGPVSDPMLESYSTLSYLAGLTQRVKLGTLVTGVIYRYPGVLVKTATTLDVLSGGRAYLGIGAGWFEREAVGLGMPFPPVKDRFEQLEETLQIAHQMWSEDNGPYAGRHNQLAETLNSPQPITRPHPPIMIGGMGEKKTLRLVAQCHHGDVARLEIETDLLRHKLAVLKSHCEAVGRPYDEIERTALGTVHLADGQMTAAQVVETCRSLASLGIQHVIFNMPNVHEIGPVEAFGNEIIPVVAEF